MLFPLRTSVIESAPRPRNGVEVRNGVGSDGRSGGFLEEGTSVDGDGIQTRRSSSSVGRDDGRRSVDGGGADSEFVATGFTVDGFEFGVSPVSVESESEIDLVETCRPSSSVGFTDDDSCDGGEFGSRVGDAWGIGADVDLTEMESWSGSSDVVDLDFGWERELESSSWVTDGGEMAASREVFRQLVVLVRFVEEGGGLLGRGET